MKKVPNIKWLKVGIITAVLIVGLLFALTKYIVRLDDSSKYIDGIYVGYEAISSGWKQDMDFQKQLEQALKGDSVSIRKIALLEDTLSASSFMLIGNVVLALIEYVGEEKFIHTLGTLDEKEKRVLLDNLLGGMQWINYIDSKSTSQFKCKTFREAFPKMYVLWFMKETFSDDPECIFLEQLW
jgi:hypothetical protein